VVPVIPTSGNPKCKLTFDPTYVFAQIKGIPREFLEVEVLTIQVGEVSRRIKGMILVTVFSAIAGRDFNY